MFPYEDSKTVSECLSVRLNLCPFVCLSVCPYLKCQLLKSPWLRQYQSYISINGKVFTSTAAWKSKNLIFLSSKFNFVRTPSVRTYPEKRNYPGFVNISPTLVIDTSMARSSRVLQYGNPKIWFFQKSSKFNFDFYFDFCWRAELTLASSMSVLHW